ncbi:hypothetical protein BCV70DRAFT_199788 [Testicularia cyperi]|uniref:Uncharacterized protein n=1 Tax=Testicularia cyperi TaxID=1882483 RepID=A0A317XQY0_9BASI|nr:hypothetical protein BCV70DRAFT_199788 [Testicularia cyperi]
MEDPPSAGFGLLAAMCFLACNSAPRLDAIYPKTLEMYSMTGMRARIRLPGDRFRSFLRTLPTKATSGERKQFAQLCHRSHFNFHRALTRVLFYLVFLNLCSPRSPVLFLKFPVTRYFPATVEPRIDD